MSAIPVVYAISRMGIGGTPHHLLEVFARLDRRRFRPLLYCFDVRATDPPVLARLRDLDVDILDGGITGWLRGPRLAASAVRLARLLRRHGARITHSYLFDANFVGTLGARVAGVPVAIASKRSLDRYPERYRRAMCRIGNRLATRVTANAQAVGRHVHEAEGCDLRKVVVIPNGIDLERISAMAGTGRDDRASGNGREHVVGTIGRLAPKKAQRDLLDAAPLVLDRVPDARFVLVGDGPLRADLERRARELDLGDRVEFRGAVAAGAAVLREIGVFVLSSHMEGMPNGVLEAMGAGLPAVVTDVGGNAEVVVDGKTGFVVPPRAPAALAEAILVLLKDPERARAMGAAGRARIAAEFTSERMVARFEALYDALLAERAR